MLCCVVVDNFFSLWMMVKATMRTESSMPAPLINIPT